MWNKGRRGKTTKDKIKLIRKYLSGESVMEDIVQRVPTITGFVFINANTGERTEFNIPDNGRGKPSWYDEVKKVEWHEEKTYPDSQFPDVRMVNPENAAVELPDSLNFEDNSNYIENTELPEKPKNSLGIVSRGLNRKLDRENKRMKIDQKMKQDIERRDKMNGYIWLNGSLPISL
jgi:hypothetical protein